MPLERELEPTDLAEADKIISDIFSFLNSERNLGLSAYPKDRIAIVRGKKDMEEYCRKETSPIIKAALTERVLNGAWSQRASSLLFSDDPQRTSSISFFRIVVYLPDELVTSTVDGTFADRDIFTEEISHALFDYSQIVRA